MTKLFITFLATICSLAAVAQNDSTIKQPTTYDMISSVDSSAHTSPQKEHKFINLGTGPADHLLLQFGSDTWVNKPANVTTGNGFSRFFNAYVMINKPFKSTPNMSWAFGLGVGSSHIFFNGVEPDLAGTTEALNFKNVVSASHFESFKLSTVYLELPLELRYFSNPTNLNKSWKVSAGLKFGYLLKAYTKGSNWVDASGGLITAYTQKISSSSYFSNTRVSAQARIGRGIFSLYGAYQLTSVFTSAAAANTNPLSIGISVGGL